MTGQQLKNSILQMAVQGKLVPQDPDDEPASVLLERIRKEKERLVREKKIKPEKNPSVIFRGTDNLPYEKRGKEVRCIADEIPFEIPDSWVWVRLSSVILTEMGQSPAGESVSTSPSGVEFHQGKVFFGRKFLLPSNQTTTAPSKIVDPGTILLCVRAPVGKVNITQRRICIGRGLCGLTPINNYDREFLYFLLESYEDIFLKKATGTTFVAITADVVKHQLIPLPPFAEQKRIVAKIEELLPHLEDYDRAETRVSKLNAEFPEQLKKSILQWAIKGKLVPQDPTDEPASVLLERIRKEKARLVKEGKLKPDKHESVIFRRDNSHYEKLDGKERCIDDEIPFEIPENWAWVRLKTLFSLQAGKSIEAKEISQDKALQMYPCYGGNGQRGYVKFYSYEGDYPIIGRQGALCGNINRAIGQFYATEHAIVVSSWYVDITWLCYFLAALDLNQYATATAQPGLAVTKINEVFIPLPPFNEQKRIADIITTTIRSCLCFSTIITNQ